MPSTPNRHTLDWRPLLFGLLAVGCLVATGWSAVRGRSPLRLLVLGALTLYAFGNLVGTVYGRGAYVSRLLALPLGVVGAVALVLGAPTDLPVFFVLLGVGSLVDLRWDPTGTVYGDAD